jgi:sugar O-acyltransferase (sialic acid O-acetyltransferase NeuD family)
MEKVIIIGSGGHAKVVIDIILEMGEFDIFGVTSNSIPKGEHFFGYLVLGDDDILPGLMKNGIIKVAMGLGGYRDNRIRKDVYNKVKMIGMKFINVIHPKSIISRSVVLGEAVTVFPGAIINTSVTIGNNVIVATGSSIDHETKIGDHVLISAGVTIGAYSIIGDEALLALGSKIISGITIGRNTLLAAGAVVVKSTGENSIMFGVPAKAKIK